MFTQGICLDEEIEVWDTKYKNGLNVEYFNFNCSEYFERKLALENRSLIDLDVEISRHNKPGIDFSNPSTPIYKPLIESM